MKKVTLVLSLICAILAIILAILPLFKLAFIPTVLALVFGLISFIKSKKDNQSTHVVQVSFLLVIIALGLSTYKTVFTVQEVGNTEELEQREKENEEKALEELEDIEIDDIEIEDLDLE
ncbi:FUSC family protein [Mesoflavibacter sp. CH_XMU1404-2]|uniref:FUSC family protein n=1 Tax=Mesoflavibacter sp. CH_XMU1404-2 TaxID=3107766 RepID=UPI00300B2481|tara:strand:- start:282 stop:638 length:357 start_codon:yes stop_codon:yes gene_type:complete